MDKRIIAIEWLKDEGKENVIKLLDCFTKDKNDSYDVIVFKEESKSIEDNQALNGYVIVDFPKEINNSAKKKNFIFDYAINHKFDGFLHIIEDCVVLDKDPLDYI